MTIPAPETRPRASRFAPADGDRESVFALAPSPRLRGLRLSQRTELRLQTSAVLCACSPYAPAPHSAVAMLLQKCSRLSSTPNNVLNTVESAIRMSPARSPLGGSQRQVLNSRLPASVKGCGRERSIGCLARTLTALESTVVTS